MINRARSIMDRERDALSRIKEIVDPDIEREKFDELAYIFLDILLNDLPYGNEISDESLRNLFSNQDIWYYVGKFCSNEVKSGRVLNGRAAILHFFVRGRTQRYIFRAFIEADFPKLFVARFFERTYRN